MNTGVNQFGALQPNFNLELPDGYVALVGANNSGKSAVMQLAFRTAFDTAGIAAGGVALILPDRTQLLASTETGGRTLDAFNGEIVNLLRSSATLSYETFPGLNVANWRDYFSITRTSRDS